MIDQKLYSQGQALHIDKMILSKDLMWSYNLISQKKIIFNFRSIFNYFLTHWFQGPFKWPLSIFLSTGANLKIIEKKRLICEAQKTGGGSTRNNFFGLFMLRRVESVFQDGKKFSIFFSFSSHKNQGGAAPNCGHYTQENSAWNIYLLCRKI